jgi:integrase/recombinase XerD
MKATLANQHINKLSNYLKTRYTPDTAKAYEREINIFLGNFPQADKAIYKDLVNYLGQLRNRYTNARTISRILASIKAYYDFLNHTEQRKDNPAKSIRLRDKQSRDIQLQDLFSSEELESLITAKKERYTKLEYRNKVLISLLVYQALHPKELEAITLNDINLQQGTIYIKARPKSNSRELALKPSQIMLFYQYIFEIRPKLVVQPQHAVAHAASQTEVLIIGHRGQPMKAEEITKHIKRSYSNQFKERKVNAQTIRQSVITNLLKAGNDLRIVQTFAGHKYPSTTERYKQTNVEALKSAVNIYHPIKQKSRFMSTF